MKDYSRRNLGRTGSSHRSQLGLVVIASVFIGSALVASLLSSVRWDASALMRVGQDDPVAVTTIEERLGQITVVPGLGHDGKYYFIQAADPFLLQPLGNAAIEERPTYYAQRMLYSMLASLGGLLEAKEIVWSLVGVNVLAIGVGTWATGRLAMAMGASPWLGLAFALNPGVLMELIIDGPGIVAWALAALGLYLLVEGRFGSALVLFCAAVLARETMLLVTGGAGAWLWKSTRRRGSLLVLGPAVAAGLWGLWIRVRLGVPLLTFQSEELGLPFAGLRAAVLNWLHEPGLSLVVGFAVALLLVGVGVQAVTRPSLVSLSVVGFVALAPLLGLRVWANYFDITRAVLPVFTGFVLCAFAQDGGWRTKARPA